MEKIYSLLQTKKQLLPGLIVGISLILAGSAAYAFSPLSPFAAKQKEVSNKKITQRISPTKVPATPTPEPSIIHSNKLVLGVNTTGKVPQPTAAKIATKQESGSTATTAQTNTGGSTNQNTTPQSTATAAPQQPTSAPLQATQIVSVEIKAPDGTSTFAVDYSDGMDVCAVLQKAKDSGKIKSVTFSDEYMSTLRSKYVSEINGFANNWTFSVNGSSPLGCSLSQPKPNDTIVWKFG